ncbi:unnamed protein product [Thlaspi arvense]|uniref:GST N-terminal domain-containing protein n=1 Tax=Thlaspi arvense TaxID=13288 RepID=A0AAU9STV8_THLAR|nr:unnamed protein product [Thlaspi arvense]
MRQIQRLVSSAEPSESVSVSTESSDDTGAVVFTAPPGFKPPEPKCFVAKPGKLFDVLGAAIGLFFRFGIGVFVSGYSASFVSKDEVPADQYALRIGGITVKETSKLGPRPEKPIEIYEFEGCPFCRKLQQHKLRGSAVLMAQRVGVCRGSSSDQRADAWHPVAKEVREPEVRHDSDSSRAICSDAARIRPLRGRALAIPCRPLGRCSRAGHSEVGRSRAGHSSTGRSGVGRSVDHSVAGRSGAGHSEPPAREPAARSPFGSRALGSHSEAGHSGAGCSVAAQEPGTQEPAARSPLDSRSGMPAVREFGDAEP